jgi:hypothetical protein
MLPALAAWLYAAVIWNRYMRTLPRDADPDAGNIYPRNIHGIVVFQTRQEKLSLDLIENISGGVFTLGFLIGALEERNWRKAAGDREPKIPQ